MCNDAIILMCNDAIMVSRRPKVSRSPDVNDDYLLAMVEATKPIFCDWKALVRLGLSVSVLLPRY